MLNYRNTASGQVASARRIVSLDFNSETTSHTMLLDDGTAVPRPLLHGSAVKVGDYLATVPVLTDLGRGEFYAEHSELRIIPAAAFQKQYSPVSTAPVVAPIVAAALAAPVIAPVVALPIVVPALTVAAPLPVVEMPPAPPTILGRLKLLWRKCAATVRLHKRMTNHQRRLVLRGHIHGQRAACSATCCGLCLSP